MLHRRLVRARVDSRLTAAGKPSLRRALAPLADNRQFRLLWFSNLLFFGGIWTQTLVMVWLAYETTQSAFLTALFTAVRLAPMLLGPFSGVFADRHNRVALLIIACTWALVAVSAVATLASLDLLPYWALLLGGLALGLAQSPSQPPRYSMVLELVGRQNLSNANALNMMATNMTQVIGPAVGGALIGVVGAPTALWISTAWYAVSLFLLLPLRGHGREVHRPTESAITMVSRGIRDIAHNRLASTVLLITVAANVLLWPVYQAFMPVFAEQNFGLGAAGLGLLFTCAGAGGLVGSLVIASLGDFRFKGGLFLLGTATWGALWSIFALSHNVVAAFVLMGCIGLMSAPFGVLQTTLLLLTTEPHLHGRALGLQELAIGVMPISALGLGAISEVFGVGATTFVSGLILVAVMFGLAARAPQLLRYDGIPSD